MWVSTAWEQCERIKSRHSFQPIPQAVIRSSFSFLCSSPVHVLMQPTAATNISWNIIERELIYIGRNGLACFVGLPVYTTLLNRLLSSFWASFIDTWPKNPLFRKLQRLRINSFGLFIWKLSRKNSPEETISIISSFFRNCRYRLVVGSTSCCEYRNFPRQQFLH